MSGSLNKVMVIGNLGRDPEIKYMPDGSPKVTFNVAASKRWKNKAGDLEEHTEWFRVVAFGKLAEICNEFLKKGMPVYVEGRQQTRKWIDETTKQDRQIVELIASDMTMLGGKDNESSSPKSTKSATKSISEKSPKFLDDDDEDTGEEDTEEEDIPF